MIETYRMLGAEREAELLREARRLHAAKLCPRRTISLRLWWAIRATLSALTGRS